MRGMDGGWADEDDCDDVEYVDEKPSRKRKKEEQEPIMNMNHSFVPISSVREMIDKEVSERLGSMLAARMPEPEIGFLPTNVEAEISVKNRVDIDKLREEVTSFELAQ